MLEFMKAMKPAQEARFKGGAKEGDSRARVARDVDAQLALMGKPKAAREFRWFSVEGDKAKLGAVICGRPLLCKGEVELRW